MSDAAPTVTASDDGDQRAWWECDDMRRKFRAENPKKKDSASAARYKQYKGETTVGEAKAAGVVTMRADMTMGKAGKRNTGERSPRTEIELELAG